MSQGLKTSNEKYGTDSLIKGENRFRRITSVDYELT